MSNSLSASQSYSGNGIASISGTIDNPTSSSVTWSITSPGGGSVSGGSGSVPPFTTSQSVSATVSGLSAGVAYTFRLLRSGSQVASTSLTLVQLYQVPSVVGVQYGIAAESINNASLSPSTTFTSAGATSENNGTVKSLSPSEGTWRPAGTTVTMTVYQYTPPSYPPAWSDNTISDFVAGQVYSDGVSATNMNYSGSYSVSSGSLPSGISLNTSTGALTGTVTSAADYSFTLTATNTYSSVSQAFSGTIAGGIRIWDGSAWVKKVVKVWSGSAWVTKTLKTWSGSSWTNSK